MTWTHKVVKRSRGLQGQWFSHRAAATFASEPEATECARAFATAQHATLGNTDGHRYAVVARKGNRTVAVFSIRNGVSRS